MYKIRVILDTEEDVFRTFLVSNDANLEILHKVIAKGFGFDGGEMASFYRSDKDWTQGEEIPLFSMSDNAELSMSSCILEKELPNIGSNLIYVYDFLNMWTFFVEVINISDDTIVDLPKTILAVGEVPEEVPNKEFLADNSFNLNEEDEFKSEFDSLDDLDLENY